MFKELGSGINIYDELEVNFIELNLYKEYKNVKDKIDRKE